VFSQTRILNKASSSVEFTIVLIGVLKHRASLARGGPHLPAKQIYDGFLLMWCNFKFEGVLFL
jgi:hypothetical protein